jgi:catechol 2,3-dioxygenase-like lactoylglutathione lyase family enzyme
MSGLTPNFGAAIGLDHVGIVAPDLDQLTRIFSGLGFHLTPYAVHESGRTANRCVMLRDGGYLELIATVPGQTSATLDRFLAIGPGAHILALEVGDETAARDRLRRAGIAINDVSLTEREAGDGKARFALLMPPDPPEGRQLLIRHLTHDLLWRPSTTTHPNHAVALTEAVYATDAPAETATRLSRLTGRPAEPDPLGGYRIPLTRGTVRVLPHAAAKSLFPGVADGPPLIGLTIAVEVGSDVVVHAGGVAIRFTAAPG